MNVEWGAVFIWAVVLSAVWAILRAVRSADKD